jgi:hypothetical protein
MTFIPHPMPTVVVAARPWKSSVRVTLSKS